MSLVGVAVAGVGGGLAAVGQRVAVGLTVVCRYGYMLMVDPDTAFTETRRVLRIGGRLVLAVWGPPRYNPFFTASVGPLVAMGHLAPPDPGGPGIFRFADAGALAESLHAAGFALSRIEEVPPSPLPASRAPARLVHRSVRGVHHCGAHHRAPPVRGDRSPRTGGDMQRFAWVPLQS